uniref:C-type lectin domain-containing protein n=1 Tax=Pygocentrus nattereri TaxID=42514 RepID=A0A3B4BW03_PYGNA
MMDKTVRLELNVNPLFIAALLLICYCLSLNLSVLFGVKCYYFSTDKLNWIMSRAYCAETGGHLVIITSRDEQDFLSSHAHETHWIGLNDLETEGKWMWVNNQTLTETGVTFWYKRTDEQHEPDNWRQEDESGENCAALGNESLGTDVWFDASCLKKKKYIFALPAVM